MITRSTKRIIMYIINLVERRMKKLLKYILPTVLILISLFLCFRNYSPGTFLIGWDSLHPEFDFPEAFGRVWEGVWRGEQGVGAVAIHSHMADLPRIIFLWLESFVLPVSFLRYSYIFLCLILGPLGVYFFLDYIFKRERAGFETHLSAFFGALFYLLNLGTLQHFFVPFEMFPTQFAFLPWLILFVSRVLREGKKKNYLLFAVLTVVSSPQAYAATLFYAYFGALCIFCFIYFLFNRHTFKRGLALILITVFFNLYWILPNIYSVVMESQTVINAKINLLFTPEAYIRNLGYEGISNVLIQKNFLFDWRAFDYTANKFTDLMQVWNQHLGVYGVLPTLYFLSGLGVLGAVISIFKKDKIGISVLAVSLYALFFLAGGKYLDFQNLHFSGSQVFAEALRMPFTKFSIIFDFCLSFFFGYFFFRLISFIKSNIKPKFLKILFEILLVILVPASLIFTTLPMFNGGLISPVVRGNLPSEYTQLFDWFKNNSNGRVAVLPMMNLWGWDYHAWNYEGSGFLTYGIKNPLLVRDFDRWNSQNEDFYSQASFALYAGDSQGFINTLKKYQVKYLILDESLINPGGSNDITYVSQIKSILSDTYNFSKKAKFGFLSVYEVNLTADEVSTPPGYLKISSDLSYSNTDPIYPLGDYIEDSASVGFPFITLDARRNVEIMAYKDGTSSANIKFTNTTTDSSVTFPVKDLILEDLGRDRGQKIAVNCDLHKVGSVGKETANGGILYTAGDGGVSCDNFDYPDIKYSQGFVLRVAGENISGRSLRIYVFNKSTGQPDLQELLPTGKFDGYYFVYPKNLKGGGYSLNFETRSFTGVPSSNILTKVEIYPVDYELLKGIYTGDSKMELLRNPISVASYKKYGTWAYKVDVQGYGLIQLGQGYDEGWIGIAKVGPNWTKLEHIKVNSWANGFLVKTSSDLFLPVSTVYLLYWPQLLEWGGMILGALTLIVIFASKARQRNTP